MKILNMEFGSCNSCPYLTRLASGNIDKDLLGTHFCRLTETCMDESQTPFIHINCSLPDADNDGEKTLEKYHGKQPHDERGWTPK